MEHPPAGQDVPGQVQAGEALVKGKLLREKLAWISDELCMKLQELAMEKEALKKRLFRPTLDFGCVFSGRALHNVWYLLSVCGFSESEVLIWLGKEPATASRRIEKHVGPRLRFFQSLGIEQSAGIKMFVAGPWARSGFHRLCANHHQLQALGLGDDVIKKSLRVQPSLLVRDFYALHEKLLFAVVVLGKDAMDAFVWPAYFTYSMENRIMFRTALCLSLGIPIASFPSLAAVFGKSDNTFFETSFIAKCGTPKDLERRQLKFGKWWKTLPKESKQSWIMDKAKA